MKVTEENIYYFSLIKGYLVPTLIIHNEDPEGEKGKEMLAYSLIESVKLLKSICSESNYQFEQVVDECLSYFNSPELLINAFVSNFEASDNEELLIERQTKIALKVEIADKVLKYIKDFLLLVNRGYWKWL